MADSVVRSRVRPPSVAPDRPRYFGNLVGSSPSMKRIFDLLERAATSDTTILLTGETGTGKEAAAESIHQRSPRAARPLVVLDCGSIPSALLESELFGHERGAFTGAAARRVGAAEAADGGTLFLDEVGELPIDLQPKLLRLLESRRIKPVGSPTYRPVDVRVIAATHRNLREEIHARRFREDLYYRLAVVEVELPPLRQRREDLPSLVDHILSTRRPGAPIPSLLRSHDFLARLAGHDWPGNVRELRNYLDRCLALGEAGPLEPTRSADSSGVMDLPWTPEIDPSRGFREQRDEWMRAFEVRYLGALMARHGGNVAAAARSAGVDRVYLYRLLWRNGLR